MISESGPTTHQYLLGDLAEHLGQYAYWNGIRFPGRFFVDAIEVPTSPVEPGVGTTESRFYCDRNQTPKPWPTLGDLLTIRGQVYEIVERNEDDLGELAFRLIKQELGLSTATSEGLPVPTPHAAPGRPTRRDEIVAHYGAALGAKLISPTTPVHEIINILRPRIGNGQGLSDRTLRKIIGGLVRARARESA
jgi:hypothetical protein